MAIKLLATISRIINVINTKKLSYQSRMDEILRLILNYLGVEQGSIMILNKKKELEIIATNKSELIGRCLALDANTVAGWVVKFQAPLFIPDISKDSRFKSRRGEYKKNSLLSAPIMSENKILGVINVTDKSADKDFFQDDISYLLKFSSVVLWLAVQQNLNAEIKKQQKTLKTRNQELRHQEASRAELSKLLIHDLKAPLSEIVANLDILSYTIPKESAEFLESARIGCERAVLMVSNLASIDKIEDGKMKLIKEELEVESLLNESVSNSKGVSLIKNIELTLEINEALPRIQADRYLILRVLQNLLTNGIGYSLSGTKIQVGCRKVQDKKQLEFHVQDQGPGIPEEKTRIIFEKYARITEKKNAILGTGLGLYFCKLAIDAHRGRIWVESTVGKGSKFIFTLPL
ncbi:MAG: GAF domain-containing protein [Proteobacteria bacterium]|nr:GAF domain-containing protein [Pseudomonadota bacterium]MBU1709738.1 GAF domain-containing protein [Pseudomonadota bacterium]